MRSCLLLVLLAFLVGTPGIVGAAEQQRAPITISSDSLEVNRKAHVAVYQGNVAANDRGRDFSLLADRIDFYFDDNMEEVQHATAQGNVRLSYGERRGVAERAEYFPKEDRAILLGHPKVWQENDMVTGCRITLLLREDRSQVDACDGERVNAVLYPKRDEGQGQSDTRR